MPAFMALAGWLRSRASSRGPGRWRVAAALPQLSDPHLHRHAVDGVAVVRGMAFSTVAAKPVGSVLAWPHRALVLLGHGLRHAAHVDRGILAIQVRPSLGCSSLSCSCRRMALAAVPVGAALLRAGLFGLGLPRGALQPCRRWQTAVGWVALLGAVVLVVGFWSRETTSTPLASSGRARCALDVAALSAGALGCLAFFGLWPVVFARLPPGRLARA